MMDEDNELRYSRESYVYSLEQRLGEFIPPRYFRAKPSGRIKIDSSTSWFIFGPPGTGKTHYAYAMQRKRLVADGRKYFGEDYESPEPYLIENVAELIGRAKCLDLGDRTAEIKRLTSGADLILDDLGSENISDFTEDFLFQIINHRHDMLRFTAFTSNFNIGELPYDSRIKSRIAGIVGANCWKMNGSDLRMNASFHTESAESQNYRDRNDFEYRRDRMIDSDPHSSSKDLRRRRMRGEHPPRWSE